MMKVDILSVMEKNWQSACSKIMQEIPDELTFKDEKQILNIITKNVYHKMPSKLPISFVEVAINTLVSTLIS